MPQVVPGEQKGKRGWGHGEGERGVGSLQRRGGTPLDVGSPPHQDESTKVSSVSVSRVAFCPHLGQSTCSHSALADARGAPSAPARSKVVS